MSKKIITRYDFIDYRSGYDLLTIFDIDEINSILSSDKKIDLKIGEKIYLKKNSQELVSYTITKIDVSYLPEVSGVDYQMQVMFILE